MLGRGDSSIVLLGQAADGSLLAVKCPVEMEAARLTSREIQIQEKLNHPLVLRLLDRSQFQFSTVVSEVMGNGSLANHLPDRPGTELCRLRGGTRIAKIVVGVALAMEYIHSEGVVHGDLTPDNILLDWDWNVRIADFGWSRKVGVPLILSQSEDAWLLPESRYMAPECYDYRTTFKSDVFSFALILYELLVGQPVFTLGVTGMAVLRKLMTDDEPAVIPKFVLPAAADLIRDCWSADPEDRPTFSEIIDRLEAMEFRITADVNSAKVSVFVKKVRETEESDANATPQRELDRIAAWLSPRMP